jgi:hypothetical protein
MGTVIEATNYVLCEGGALAGAWTPWAWRTSGPIDHRRPEHGPHDPNDRRAGELRHAKDIGG